MDLYHNFKDAWSFLLVKIANVLEVTFSPHSFFYLIKETPIWN